MHFLNGFAHADGKFHFKAPWEGRYQEMMPRLPGYLDRTDQASDEHPFRLVTAPARSFLNTSFTETPGSQKREVKPTVKIHPETAAELDLAEGDRVRLGNERGSVVVAAELFDGLQRNVVVVESIFPNSAFEEGLGINTLVSAEAGPPKGGAVFHDTAVWVRKA